MDEEGSVGVLDLVGDCIQGVAAKSKGFWGVPVSSESLEAQCGDPCLPDLVSTHTIPSSLLFPLPFTDHPDQSAIQSMYLLIQKLQSASQIA